MQNFVAYATKGRPAQPRSVGDVWQTAANLEVDSREDPLLLVGQLLDVSKSERKEGGIPQETELKGILVSPIASDLSALGESKGYFSEGTNNSGQQVISIRFEYQKAGEAKFLFYAPATKKDFTLFVLKQKPVRFSLKPRK